MIEEMRLKDLGVIAEATLPIGPGFTAITGETGAGKTMVVTGLGLLLGQRADSSAVRAGAEHAAVAGVWIVPSSGAVADRVADAGGELEPISSHTAELYVSRTITVEGRSRASVGGAKAPAGVLSDLAGELIVVHGQADQMRLRSSVAQRQALDRFAGASVAQALADYRETYREYLALDERIDDIAQHRDARAAEAANLRLVLAEIEQAEPQPGEDDELAQRAERLSNAEGLRLAAATAHESITSENDSPHILALVAEARRSLERANDPALSALSEQLADLGYRAIDIAQELSGYLADLDDAGPHELATVEDRRAVLGALVRAHGSLNNAIALRETGAARLAELDDDPDTLGRLAGERDALGVTLDQRAAALTAARVSAASRLGIEVTAELRELALPDAHLEVSVVAAPATAAGRDEVIILLAPHPGATARPVAKSASGGELSRVMLAIEVVMSGSDPVPTFVFDEVDAGIGGAAAIEVGRRLARLAQTAQVIAVTHLAQVAAFANNHLSVVKQSDGSVTASSVRALEGAEREAEMARLLSGMTDSAAALAHARELLGLRTTI